MYSAELSPTYYEFVGVRSCQDVVHLYRLLWVSTVLNILGLCMGIVTAAVLGAFKDMVSDVSQHVKCAGSGALLAKEMLAARALLPARLQLALTAASVGTGPSVPSQEWPNFAL